jgi:hypothetical protein
MGTGSNLRRLRAAVPVLLLAVSGCGSQAGASDSLAGGTPFDLPTYSGGQGSGAHLDSMAAGVLVSYTTKGGQTCLALGQSATPASGAHLTALAWPQGWRGIRHGDRVEVVNDQGTLMATAGQTIDINGGGSSDQPVGACVPEGNVLRIPIDYSPGN